MIAEAPRIKATSSLKKVVMREVYQSKHLLYYEQSDESWYSSSILVEDGIVIKVRSCSR